MELHTSPPHMDEVLRSQRELRECLLCAFVKSVKIIPQPTEPKISNSETHYWIEQNRDSILTPKVMEEIKKMGNSDHVNYYAQMYSHYTDIPPEKAMLVETIEFSSTQLSASWKFIERK